MKIVEYLDQHDGICILLGIIVAFTIIGITINKEVAKMYKVQAEIVIHDYGHVYENINDWKLEKIEKFEKEIRKDV